jgi:integration host factor subunit beta
MSELMEEALVTGGTMTKAELVEEVARAAELTKKDSEVIVEEVFKNIIEALNRGEKIELRGFGSFRVRQRDARRGRNPKTGAPVDIPAKRVPYFKPGKELKELINAVLGEEPGGGEVISPAMEPRHTEDGDAL